MSTYRDRFRPMIARVIATNREPRQRNAALWMAWESFNLGNIRGPAGYAYKIWRDEVRRQLGLKPRLPGRKRKIPSRKLRSMNAAEVREWFAKRQMALFEGAANVVPITRRRKA